MTIPAPCGRHVSASRPLRPNVTSSIKPEVHNVAQRRQRRTTKDLHTKFCKDRPAVPEICSRTDRHTHRQMGWSQYSAPLPGGVNTALVLALWKRVEHLLTSNVTGRHRGSKWKLQRTSYFFIVECGIAHFLCAMRVFEGWASSSSARQPLCQISFLWQPLMLS